MRHYFITSLHLLILLFALLIGTPAHAAIVPDQPTINSITSGNGQATINFTRPVNNGVFITGYIATCGTNTAKGTLSPIIVTGLTNGTIYSCTIFATSVNGAGFPSDPFPVTPAAVEPDPPTIVSAIVGDEQTIVSFTAPNSDGGSQIMGYSVTCDSFSANGAESPIIVPSTPYNPGIYSCTVTATNAVGTSAASSTFTTTRATLPFAPSIFSAVAGNAQITLTFVSINDGGSKIVDFTATCSPIAVAGNAITVRGTGSPITITGLTNGSTYRCTVRAWNFLGGSQPSVDSSNTRPQGAQSIIFNPVPTMVVGGTETLSATGGASGNAITYSIATTTGVTACSVSGNIVKGLAAGTCMVTANQAGNDSYTSATPVTQSIAITKAAQTITFTEQGAKSYSSSSFTLNPLATASSGLAVTYTSTTLSVCTIGNSTVSILAGGICTIAANQAGNAAYSAAPQVTQDITINKASQTISFGTQTGKIFGAAPFKLNPLATASSGLAVTYTSTTPSVCTITDITVTIVAGGICAIAANQAGNGNYSAATPVTQNISIDRLAQKITFSKQTGNVFGAASFKLSPLATASSGLAITYTSMTPSVCTISDATVTIVAAGVCSIVANQPGNGNYHAATPVTQNIPIDQLAQKISFPKQTGKVFGAAPFKLNPLATASSTLPVTYASTTPSVCTISDATVTIVAAGVCIIVANQAGNGNYRAAEQLMQSIAITKASQIITFPAQSARIFDAVPFMLNPLAVASSGLDVTYSSSTGKVCTLSGTTVTALSASTCTIRASQPGNGNYNAAAAVSQNIIIGKQAIPAAPVLNNIAPGFGSATINFSAPNDTGNSIITAYTATCTATGETARTGKASGTASTITVSAMTINVTYSCSVTASNSIGTSTPSAALPVTPTSTYVIPTTSSPLTGLWWNADESGWGMSITQHGPIVFIGWYTYDQTGSPTWYSMSSCPIQGNACTGDIYTISGGKSFVTPWDETAKVVTKAGDGILAMVNDNTGVFNFTINGVSGSKSIVRSVFATGPTLPDPDFSDLWWSPGESGWGVALTQQHETIVAALFGYNEAGDPVWYVASNCQVSGTKCSGDLYRAAGGINPFEKWNGDNLLLNQVGFVEFVFTDSTNGAMNLFIDGVSGTKVITRLLF